MAWIESHQSLRMHTKTLTAVAELRVDRHKFLGHLMCLWWWGLDVADLEGHLPAGTTPAVIAAGAEWPIAKAESLTSALLSARFLELVDGRYVLHDWWEYAGKINAKRASNKQRMRESRATHVQRTEPERAAHVQGLPTNQPVQPTKPTNQTDPVDAIAVAFGKFGKVTAGTSSAIDETVNDYGLEWTQRAVKEAAKGGFDGSPPWSYVDSICERWKAQGGPDDDKPRLQTAGRANGHRNDGIDLNDLDARLARL